MRRSMSIGSLMNESIGNNSDLSTANLSTRNLTALIEQEAGSETNPKVFLRQISADSTVSDDIEDSVDIDKERLLMALAEAGKYSYGIASVELWIFDEETGWLSRPERGSWWTNPEKESSSALRRLNDPTEKGYIKPTPTMPGVDLAGILFNECMLHTTHKRDNKSDLTERPKYFDYGKATSGKSMFSAENMSKSLHSSRKSVFSISSSNMNRSFHGSQHTKPVFQIPISIGAHKSKNESEPVGGNKSITCTTDLDDSNSDDDLSDDACKPKPMESVDHAIKFRDIHSLILDPDTPKSNRLNLIGQAGFTHAAGVPFQSGWHTGIVIYYTCCKEKDFYLTSIPNQVYMIHAAECIGAIVASTDSRRAALAWKIRAEKQKNHYDSESSEEARNKSTPADKKNISCDLSKSFRPTVWNDLELRVNQWWRKCKGGNLQPPPGKSYVEAAWTFVCVFFALIIILSYSEAISTATNGEYSVLLGPIGALMTLQYALSPAPASQPRNVIYGQLILGVVTLPWIYVPIPVVVRQSLAVAFAVAAMSKLGVIHPPAGGAAIILSSGRLSGVWLHYLLIVSASVISLFPSIVLNNLSQKRQYPTYWGLFKRS